ncbi:ATP synthase subunit delta [Hyella patelloides LEGE 07179]|uniref:ATP synthase subunit delta n=1 Tax=Hyella patelloides LEGE 07179 TaxID=945734 RepID=A0A563VS52_9CYAN|nr:ATP synthase F1 subunit delta [Hyella patelloides]VEP14217.1 ATP synthase subunit delta [Hyella patelloides LEGE 07179]
MSGTLISSEVAEPYAQALMSVAQQNNLTEPFGSVCRDLESLMEESTEFSDFVANPVVNPEAKKEVLRQVMGNEANPYFVNFLMLLVDKRRIIFLKEIAAQFSALLRKLNNVVLAEVTSATELNDGQKQALVDRVKGITDASDVELKITIDPELIGGVIIKVGSKVIDASVQGQLRRIGMSLGSVA